VTIRTWPGMTCADVGRKIQLCAQKRDHSYDVAGKFLLGMTYQLEIHEWVAFKDTLPPETPDEKQSRTSDREQT
jgi:hypothetical protein